MVPWQSIQGFSGSAAVGSLVFVGWVLIANAFANNLVPTIDRFSETQAWAVVIAVPVRRGTIGHLQTPVRRRP
jgi:hypothetical protein